jgi:hypothetical protein
MGKALRAHAVVTYKKRASLCVETVGMLRFAHPTLQYMDRHAI